LVISGVGTAFQNTLFKRTKGKIEEMGKRERRREQLLDNLKEKKMLEFERGSTRSQSVENSLWKRLWTCRKAGYVKNDPSVYMGKYMRHSR
jgi:hypothetical protein